MAGNDSNPRSPDYESARPKSCISLDEVTFYDFALGQSRSHKCRLRLCNFVNTKLNFVKYATKLWSIYEVWTEVDQS